jgi:hypothetical protein
MPGVRESTMAQVNAAGVAATDGHGNTRYGS